MNKRRKIWIGIGACILAGGAASPPAAASDTGLTRAQAGFDTPAGAQDLRAIAQAFTTGAGEAGEGGEGGEGGEAGIDVAAAAKDPVEYGVALQVIAAHYHAGLAAYRGKEQEAGAQMFAHGLSEVYVEMEEVFKARGVTNLGKLLENAVQAANEKKPPAEVKRRADAVFAALDAAGKKAPKSAASERAVKAQVLAAVLERAAAQFGAAQKDGNLEAYLDGLGFAMAARSLARDVSPWLRKADPAKVAAVEKSLALTARAYPGIERPTAARVEQGELLAAASGARLAVSGLK